MQTLAKALLKLIVLGTSLAWASKPEHEQGPVQQEPSTTSWADHELLKLSSMIQISASRAIEGKTPISETSLIWYNQTLISNIQNAISNHPNLGSTKAPIPQTLRRKALKWSNRYKERYVYKGPGYVTFYALIKAVGNVLGIWALKEGHTELLAALNVFPYNSSLALAINYPLTKKRNQKLFAMMGGDQTLERLQQNKALQDFFKDASPNGISDLPKIQLLARAHTSSDSFTLSKLWDLKTRPEPQNTNLVQKLKVTYQNWRSQKSEAKIYKKIRTNPGKPFSDFISNSELQEFVKSESIAPEIRLLALLTSNTDISHENELKSKNIETSDLDELSKSLELWLQKFTEATTEQDIKNAFAATPSNLSSLEKNMIWVNVVVPYLFHHKKDILNVFQIRALYLSLEESLAASIREAVLTNHLDLPQISPCNRVLLSLTKL